jgi:D-3-phosphoglycerate dehydrogenase
MAFKVVITSRSFSKASPEPLEILRRNGCEPEYKTNPNIRDDQALAQLIGDADAVIVGDDRVTELVYSGCPNLKVISKHGVGVDAIDIAKAREYGIKVTRAIGANHESTADLTIAFILALYREFFKVTREMKANRASKASLGTDFFQKTLGIIGFGRVGKAVARRAKGFDCRVLVYDPYVLQEFAGVEFVRLDALLKSADIVSLHCTLTEETHGFFGKKEFSLMKPSALFINTARAELVDESALVEVLKGGEIFGAALDVYSDELLNSSIIELDNLILTPHIGAHTRETNIKQGIITAENVVRVLKGEPPLFEV